MLRLLVAPMEEDPGLAAWLSRVLRGVYMGVEAESLPEPMEAPGLAYDPARGQYRSEYILLEAARLRSSAGVDAVLIVAGVDAYADGLNFVFGEALLGEGAAVVYTPRLRPQFYGGAPDEGLFRERLLKEAMHELGHAFGLEHCGDPRCVMSFSNSIAEVDAKRPAYCPRCARILSSAGVEVSPRYVLGGPGG